MAAKVLVVEDEEPISQLLAYNLQKEGFKVATAADGDEALVAVAEDRPDIVLLDWMLPNVSGIELCRQFRARNDTREVPVIMLTARGEEEDRVRGLDVGADDYVTKPFSMSELVARMRAVLRRTAPAVAGDVASFADLVLDRELCRVRRGKRDVHLGPTEFRLLDALMQRPGAGVLARAAARPGLGPGRLRRDPHRRRAHRPAAPGAEPPRRPRPDTDGPLERLRARRDLRGLNGRGAVEPRLSACGHIVKPLFLNNSSK